MSKSLAEQLARFGFKSKTADAVEAPEGFDDEETANAPEVTETKVEVSSTEAVEAEAPKAEVSEAETVKEAPKTEETTPELLARVAHLVMESESPKVEEAPKTEIVAEATPAPEVKTPAVTAAETTSVKKSPKSVSRMRIVDEDVDIDITGIGEVKPISNRGLRKFKENVFGKNSLKEIPREYVIDGVLGKSTGIPCVWEEGGADMASGYALLVADKDGKKKAPVLCLHDKDVSNGKHALIPVAEGDLILLGVMRKLDETEICCTIGTVTRIDTDERVLITISPAFCVEEPAPVDEDANEDDEATSDDLKIQYTDDSLSFINADHPLLVAGMERVQEKFCHEPKYVRPYVPYKFNKIINDDLNRTFADTKFVQTLQVFNTTNEAYDALEQVIGSKVAAATKRESVLVTTVLNINKDSQGNDCIFIYIVGCVFNSAKEVCSSQGGRFFYARVKVLPEETFTYIDDRDKFLTYAQAVAQMTLAGKKWVADTVKRVTV